MIEENKTVVDAETANKKFEDALAWVGRSRRGGNTEAKVIRERFSARGGILRLTRTKGLEFVHNTFKEYLAASIFVSDLNVEFLADNAPREDCANVCRFAAAFGSPAYTRQLIDALLKRKDRATARKLVAVRMSTAASSLEPAARAKVKKIEGRMFPPKSESACKALAELGNEVLDKLRYSPTMNLKSQLMCANTLSRIATPEARDALEVYAVDANDFRLVEQLCRILNPLKVPYVRRRLAPELLENLIFFPTSITGQITDDALSEWVRANPTLFRASALNLQATSITDLGLQALVRGNRPLRADLAEPLGHTNNGRGAETPEPRRRRPPSLDFPGSCCNQYNGRWTSRA